MRRIIILAAVLISCTMFAQEQSIIPKGRSTTKPTLEAIELLKEGTPEGCAKAEQILMCVIEDQEKDENARNYGCWGWVKNGPNRDLNMPLFAIPNWMGPLWDLQDKMSENMRQEFLLACDRMAVAAQRRFAEETFPMNRFDIEYSNAACMVVEAYSFMMRRYPENERYKRFFLSAWTKLYDTYRLHAFGEFMSTHYDDVDFMSLLNAYRNCDDKEIKAQIQMVLDETYVSEIAGSHPLLKVPLMGSSRDYRECQTKGDCRSHFIIETPEDYKIPKQAIKYRDKRKYPFEFEGRAGSKPFVFKSYQLQDAGMGSMTGWGNYFWQQIHCIGSAGLNENARATFFIPGTYNPINGFTHQEGMTTLCVYNQYPSLWHVTGKKTSVEDVRATLDRFGIGISMGEFKEVLNKEGELKLTAYGYDFYFFAFEVNGGYLEPCYLEFTERTQTSHRYHKRKAYFGEYMFPKEFDWAGVLVKVVKSGQKVERPQITFKEKDGITTVEAKSEGLKVEVAKTEIGAYVAIPKENLDLMPRRRFNQ